MTNISDTASLTVLIVDDEATIRKTLSLCLATEGHAVRAVSTAEDALAEASRRSFDVAFVDLRLGISDGLDLMPRLTSLLPWIKIIVITAYASIDSAVEAMRRGASDYISKPFTPAQVHLALRKVWQISSLEQRIAALQEDLGNTIPEMDFTSASPPMERVFHVARHVAGSDATILLRGESGTGKTVLAKAIHSWSSRASKPLGMVSCPALPAELLEAELFGHVKGAFTGAVRNNPGRIAGCEGGTILLDEIGDLPLALQPKLLRFLQDREYEAIGEYTAKKADVRIIAATNTNLEQAVKEGRFREDLLYRLNVIQIDIPPLRQRPEDIKALAERMLLFYGRKNHRMFHGFTAEAMEALQHYCWPGNIRELHNAIERAAILCHCDQIGVENLPGTITPLEAVPALGDPVPLATIEEQHIRMVLASTRSLQEAAEILGIDQATLWRRRRQYNI